MRKHEPFSFGALIRPDSGWSSVRLIMLGTPLLVLLYFWLCWHKAYFAEGTFAMAFFGMVATLFGAKAYQSQFEDMSPRFGGLSVPSDLVSNLAATDGLDRTERMIRTLVAPAQVAARSFMARLRENLPSGYTAEIISGTRTYAEQDALFNKRPKVTNARGGYSNHNFGVAWDIGLFQNGRYLENSPTYKLVGKTAHEEGLLWGGDWSRFQDEPHVEWRPTWAKDLSESDFLAECRQFHARGEAIA